MCSRIIFHNIASTFIFLVPPHTFLMTQIRNVLQKWHPGSIVLKLTSTKNRNCKVCLRTKITLAPCRRRNGETVHRAEKFGVLIAADREVLIERCESRQNHRYKEVVQDLATQWIQSYPCKTENFSVEGKEFTTVSRAI